MNLHQVTRHLEVRPDNSASDSVLLINLLTGTRLLLAPAQAWSLLERFQYPHELDANDPVQARAGLSEIVVPVAKSQETQQDLPLISRFDEVSSSVLRYRKTEPSGCRFERLEALEKACLPVSDKRPSDYFIWQDPSRVFRILLDHFATYLQQENTDLGGDKPPTLRPIDVDAPQYGLFVKQSLSRPPCEPTLEQQISSLSTAWARAERVAERFPQGGKVLFLGDDDLVSLALSQWDRFEIDVLEIDLKLVRLLKREGAGKLKVERCDLSGGLPRERENLYDVVVSDPMYSAEGMEMFVESCAPALKEGSQSRLFLSTYPPLLEAPEMFEHGLNEAGLQILRVDENFNRYPFPEENRETTKEGLITLGYHPKLVRVLTDIPYLYAHLYECGRL